MKNTILVLVFIFLSFFAGFVFGQESWTATSTTNVLPRQAHTTVWTGTKMIVWGGNGANLTSRIGSIYDPITNLWAIMDSTNAPSTRNLPTSVWTGSKMIVWGGQDYNGNSLKVGGIYDPLTNLWTPTSTTNEPAARCFHTAVWTGTYMVVWGGYWGIAYNNGGLYDPVSNTWTTISSVSAPSERYYHIAIWTGTKMIIWGGGYGAGFYNTGGIYDPSSNTWTETSVTNAPSGRWNPAAVWTGTKMIIWGGQIDVLGGTTRTGGIYNPQTNSWEQMDSTGAPPPRTRSGAVWTGSRMVVWGGASTVYLNTGGIYNPLTNTWTATSIVNVPAGRQLHSMVWTGNKMIIWGGNAGNALNTGGIYQNSSIGILKAGNEIPTEFLLSQNYPNPFNSVTKMQFQVPSLKFIKLIVFDMLGREVATLVNEKLQPGTYEVRFDAGNLTSGIYFYQLKSENFIETKKLIILK